MPEPELPEDIQQQAARLTRLARDALDSNERAAYLTDRDEILSEHGFVARHREDDDVLVLYPDDWLDADGNVDVTRIDDTDRGIERPLSGTGTESAWHEIEAHNASLVESVEAEHGPDHGKNARAFADFLGNHYVRKIETAGAPEVREFLEEYYPRNAWPTEEQRSIVGESLELLFDAAGVDVPEPAR
ncbi:rnhA operon protein [Haloferax namakaokahaiae]|uniref:RnhA operon protein n=1 Tax=Haloferax namakaokahaiae TaxID=1748331 RepID=A0ABD5ZGP4_9EURY